MKGNFNILLIPSVLLCLLLSCDRGNDERKTEGAVARVYDRYLYRDDIQRKLHPFLNKSDSSAFVNTYVDKWIENQLMAVKAEADLSEKEKDLERELEEYRNTLLIYNYERSLINKKLDTVIADSIISGYYESNKHLFRLKSPAIRFLYVKVNKNASDLQRVKNACMTPEGKNISFLGFFCAQNTQSCMINEHQWFLLEELLKNLPGGHSEKNPEQWLKRNFHQLADSSYIYFLNILEFKPEGETAPLDIEKANIKKMLLSQKKISLIRQIRKDIYHAALSASHAEIYTR